MNPLTHSTILFTLMAGTAIVMTSSHWLLSWAGLEMSMLSMIPLMINKANPRTTEASTKYFLMQATASMILMMAITSNFYLTGHWMITTDMNYVTSAMITVSLLMKLGMAPFHFWMPEVTQGTSLPSGMLLLTWQKIAPMSILMQISPSINQNLILSSAMLSILLGGWGGLNQTQLRKILAYSSISHMGWMAAILTYNPTLALLNLLIYVMLTATLFMLFMLNSNTTTLSLSLLWNKTPTMLLISSMALMSLGGLPPLMGFLPKWLIIQEMVNNKSIALATMMSMMALLNLYFYMRLIYSMSMTMFPSMNNLKMTWQYYNKKNNSLLPILFVLYIIHPPSTYSLHH
uniref:NADH-ubiquinone oxidoreductase chain 2 n=1 Tax=Zenkerella insignis TaxID=101669 RepID=A0A343EVU1_9RODE|nr:NADH dehydrogenase subunit 2 [Zenkerella insignis]ASM91477.1 NADH dehydrogenase subunit 2 [Zenkerella insignis]